MKVWVKLVDEWQLIARHVGAIERTML